ncbi:MAG: SDR family oxidoreductase [Actinobacteria bacterium]|nr:SDR family oxidoreductase [Actinomycetota bacterium]
MIIPNRFLGKVCIVTGAESGIGNATATRFAEEGAEVYGLGLDKAQGEAWQADQQSKGNKVLFLQVDVSNHDAVKKVIDQIAKSSTRIDVLVNNAAIFDYHKVEDLPEDVWDKVMAVNVKSIYLTSKYCIPHMRANGGSITNIASVHAFATMDSVPVYAASKGAVVALSRQMAIDYIQDGIRVNSVVVGGVNTAMSRKHAASVGKSLDELGFVQDPKVLGRTADPKEIAAGITYLASDDASFVVGSAFLIDGGLTANL